MKHPAEDPNRNSAERRTRVKVLKPFIVGAPFEVPREAATGDIVTVEFWQVADLSSRGLAEQMD